MVVETFFISTVSSPLIILSRVVKEHRKHQYFSKEIYNVNYFLDVIENYYVKDYLLIESK